MNKYPKIQTLFDRYPKGHENQFKVDASQYRWPEFKNIKKWFVTEKIDGMNMRMIWEKGNLRFAGRTDRAQIPKHLGKYLDDTFTSDKLKDVFGDNDAVLYGEGYGPKIQKGERYRDDVSYILFDVFVQDMSNPLGGWWLEPENIQDVATKLGIDMVPVLGRTLTTGQIVTMVEVGPLWSELADKKRRVISVGPSKRNRVKAEGIVARTKPLMFTRKGERVMWKLKIKDFC